MQAQPDIPHDMICKDKFLVRCAMVVAGTTEEDITSAMFAQGGKSVEEKSLTVILPEEHNPNSIENFSAHQTVYQEKEALTSTKADNAKLTKFNTMILKTDSVKQEDINIDSELIEAKSQVLKNIFDCGRISGKPLVLKIDGEEEIPLKSLFYFLHQDTMQEDITKNPYDIYVLLLVADKYCVISCTKECSRLLRGLKMIEVSIMYLDPWSILIMNDAENYRMIKYAKKFLMDKYKDIERFPPDVKTILTSLEGFLIDKFNDIQRAPEKFGLYLVEAVFQSDKLLVDSEDEVYDVLMQWSKVHYSYEQQRIKFLTERIDVFVRFKFMSRQKLLEAKNYWNGYSIRDKIMQGFCYHSRSPKATCKRFIRYKTGKKDGGNEDILDAAARTVPYENTMPGILEVNEENSEVVKERAYRRRPIRTTLKNDYDNESCCVYMELKWEHCSKILVDGKCDSQVFYPLKGV